MTRSLSLVGLALLASCATTSQDVAEPRAPAPPDAGLAVSQLVELEHARAEALTQADAFSLEMLLEAGYRGLTWEGQRRTKGQEVERVRAEGARSKLTFVLVSDELEVRSYGDFAVVTGRGNVEKRPAPSESAERGYHALRFTHVWLWRDGRWQMVASHESATR